MGRSGYVIYSQLLRAVVRRLVELDSIVENECRMKGFVGGGVRLWEGRVLEEEEDVSTT